MSYLSSPHAAPPPPTIQYYLTASLALPHSLPCVSLFTFTAPKSLLFARQENSEVRTSLEKLTTSV
ncbi:hypothetical protein E2C01_044235 [Portunus trituberculatus]|uniref:Uncharacterized protein n=1 Tax=Portunus trituberculatus TaxID=210409 RepID=A0A5B7FYA5_PORTR|nr:hypothetical protein [Portunus trituberculatus]